MKRLFIALAILTFSTHLLALEPVSKGLFSNVAIGGIDTVSYHEVGDGKEKLGTKRYGFAWNGAIWRFADRASRDKFAANPQAWVPQFNGHCANALSLGEGLIQTDGTVWAFFDDKLYLFYAERGLVRWQSGDYRQYQKEAERAWQLAIGN